MYTLSARAIWVLSSIERIDPISTKQVEFCRRKQKNQNIFVRISCSSVLISNGSEWWRLRSEFQKGLSAPQHIRQFLTDSDAITKEFIECIDETKPNVTVPNVLPELSKLNLECKFTSSE